MDFCQIYQFTSAGSSAAAPTAVAARLHGTTYSSLPFVSREMMYVHNIECCSLFFGQSHEIFSSPGNGHDDRDAMCLYAISFELEFLQNYYSFIIFSFRFQVS